MNAPREIYTKGMTIILVTNSQREDCPGEQCCEIVEVQRCDNLKKWGGGGTYMYGAPRIIYLRPLPFTLR